MRTHRRKRTRSRHTSQHAFKVGLALLGLMLLSDSITAHFFTQIEAALSLSAIHTGSTIPVQPAMPTSSLTLAQPTLAQDTFSHANQTFWGIASDGQRWQADAMSSPGFAIVNHAGQVANGNGIYDAILGPHITNAEVVFSGSLSRFGPSTLGALLRWTDAKNLYKAYLDGAHLILLRDETGIVTMLKSVAFVAQEGQLYTFRFRVLGSLLSAKVWPANAPEPANWMVTTIDTSLSSGYGGLRVVLRNGITATITSFTESKL